jgi:O-acetyl-ADP-ribose deacetylase (regulator of RNase III)
MKTVQGNLIHKAQQNEFDVIIHGCNCFCQMGAGIAKTIKQTFPEAYAADQKTSKGDKNKLGRYSYATVQVNGNPLTIINAYTQFEWWGKGNKADYKAIESVFRLIKKNFSGKRIGYPAIGAGLAGGKWDVISKIIETELEGEDHTFVEFK